MRYFFYVYVLKSLKDNRFYVGCTENLNNRLEQHKKGEVKSTKNRLPIELVYFEGCQNKEDAFKREKYLKTAWGKRYIKNRLRSYLMG
jgi:putative endonuclease